MTKPKKQKEPKAAPKAEPVPLLRRGARPKILTAEEIQSRLEHRQSVLDRLTRKGITILEAANAIGKSRVSVTNWLYGHSVSAPVEAGLMGLLKAKRRQ